ncbi:phosphorylase family protein [Vibrio rotiferianus]|uniref:phosphorylase family protein n=1 Tax=Vibrio rotiferianus TaxID=190895 RepID=UPI0005EF2F24|nr:response regulator [Vibrio rotiferianus]
MKILIVDDSTEKTKEIACALNEFDDSVCIDNATHAADARKKLLETEYDLVILDLALPKDIYMDPKQEVGYRLLTEILDSGSLIPPKKVFCLTEFNEVFRDYSEIISEELVAIHQFSFEHSTWKNALEKEVRRQNIKTNVHTPKEHELDILIVCALKEPELEQILDCPLEWDEPELYEDFLVMHRGVLRCDDKEYSVIATNLQKMGSVQSGIISTKLINTHRPKFVLMTGICAGDSKETRLGDILVASPSWSWESGKWLQEGNESNFHIDPHQISISPKISSLIDLLSTDKSFLFGLHDGYKANKPSQVPRLLSGPVACGSSVIASNNVYKDIKKQNRKIMGLEMESFGLYSACELASEPKPLFLSIKGISDFADEHKQDDLRNYASFVSARTAIQFIKKFHLKLF